MISVATLVHGRRGHLAGLLGGLSAQQRPADEIVVVRMDSEPLDIPDELIVRIVDVPAVGGLLPLARARNAAIAAVDAEQTIFLDVDCIPGPGFVAGYEKALTVAGGGLVCGEVRYLDEAAATSADFEALARAARRHPARPAPLPGELFRHDVHHLAWTTSLAMSRRTFDEIGGFDENFVGYGAEDTDFTERARVRQVPVWWTGDALALHQYHPSSVVGRVPDLVRNAWLFRRKHGWWPMRGWLNDLAQQGFVVFDETLDVLRLA